MSRFAHALRASLEDASVDQAAPVETAEDTVIDVSADPAKAAEAAAAAAAEAGEAAEAAADAAADAAEAAEAASAEDVIEVPAVVSADEVVVDNSDSLDEAVEEVAEAEVAVDEEQQKVDELEEAAAGLESIQNLLREAQQTGGLTKQAATMATIAVESYTSRLGLEEPIMASLESFGGSSTRLAATKLSMEAIGEKLRTIWAAIIKFLINIKNKVWEFIKRLFVATERLKARGEKLAKIELQGSAKSNEIELKGYAKKVAVGTTVQLDARKGLADLIATVEGAAVLDAEQAKQVDILKSMADQLAAGTLKADQIDDKFLKLSAPKGFTDRQGQLFTAVLPGNVQYAVAKKKIGKFEFAYVVKKNNEANVSEEAKIKTMSLDQIRATGAEAIKLYEAVGKLQKQAANAASAIKSLQPVKAKEGLDQASVEALNQVTQAFRQASANHGQLSAKVGAHAVSVAFTYLKIAEKSAGQYTGKSKALVA